jgi:hypothetical protein
MFSFWQYMLQINLKVQISRLEVEIPFERVRYVTPLWYSTILLRFAVE